MKREEIIKAVMAAGWSRDSIVILNAWMHTSEFAGNTCFSMIDKVGVTDGLEHFYAETCKIPMLRRVLPLPGWVQAYCDGSGLAGGTKPGGIGVVITGLFVDDLMIAKQLPHATNNVAELAAVQRALMEIANPHQQVEVCTDSQYAIGIVSDLSWVPKTNVELVNAIRADLALRPNVTFKHVPGHDGVYGNELADALAGVARKHGHGRR